MTKRVLLNEFLKTKFNSVFGEDSNESKYYIFSCRAISTESLTQPGSIHHGAHLTKGTISEIVSWVNDPTHNVSMHTMHESYKLSSGRWFAAEYVDEGEHASATFYGAMLDNEENASVIEKIESNILDEVSVSFLPRHLKCSNCEHDFKGELKDWFFDWTCPECGSVIGVDCTLIEEGVEEFFECSIVNQGAAKNPKILKQEVSEEDYFKLAASCKRKEKSVFTGSCLNKEKKMENEQKTELEKELEAKVIELEAKVKELTPEPEPEKTELEKELEAKVVELEKQLSEKEELLAETSKKLDSEKEAKLSAETSLKEYKEFLQNEVKKVLIASQSKETEVPEDLAGISELLESKKAILASMIPVGGVSQTVSVLSNDDVCKHLETLKLSSFQVKQ